MPLRPPQAAALLALIALLAAACADAIPVAPNDADGAPAETVVEADCGWLRWSEAEATVADWFDAHPDSAALHWWDAGARVFRTARRGDTAAPPFEALARGMLLWREQLDEQSPQLFAAQDTVGVIPLRRGFNLIPWADGGAEINLRDALRWLGPNLVSAAHVDLQVGSVANPCGFHWDRRVEGIGWVDWPTPADGDLLALELDEAAAWLQPWAGPPQLLTGVGVDADAQDELWREWRAVTGYMATRYRSAAPLRAVTLQPDFASVIRGLELLRGEEFPPASWPLDACGGEIEGWIGLMVGCQDPIAFDHEYVHALQNQAVTGGRGRAAEIRPLWLVEGMAMYLAARYRDDAGHETYDDARAWAIDTARLVGRRLPLNTIETHRQWRAAPAGPAYALGLLAAEWLAAQAGDDALFYYMRQLQRWSNSWEIAFEAAFGLRVDEFYAAWNVHALSFERPLPHRLSGAVLDPRGEPVADLQVYAYPRRPGRAHFGGTDADGRFTIALPADRYRLIVQSGGNCTEFGAYREGETLGNWQEATLVEVRPGDTPEVVVRLSAPVAELRGWSLCAEPDSEGWVRGRVLNADGRGAPNVFVWAFDDAQGFGAGAETDFDGRFAFDAAPGRYRITVGPAGDWCLTWGARGPGGNLVPSSEAALLEIADSPLRNIKIHLPVALTPRDNCW